MKFLSSTSYTLPAVVSIGLHLVLAGLAFWGWQASSDEQRVAKPRYIEAKIVQLEAAAPKAAPPKPEPKVVDVAARRAEAERQRREEEARKAAEQKRKQQAEEKRRQEAEKKRKEEQARKEKERREAAERERKAQEQREAEQRRMQEALAEEMEAERSRLQAQENASIAQSYTALISDRIESQWSRPPSARNGMKTELRIQLVPTGRVVSVSVVKSSGNSAFDRSAEQAVWKAEQFPELQKVPGPVFEQYFRQLTLVFSPEDLRQ
jgi:colicin import membrane protein